MPITVKTAPIDIEDVILVANFAENRPALRGKRRFQLACMTIFVWDRRKCQPSGVQLCCLGDRAQQGQPFDFALRIGKNRRASEIVPVGERR